MQRCGGIKLNIMYDIPLKIRLLITLAVTLVVGGIYFLFIDKMIAFYLVGIGSLAYSLIDWTIWKIRNRKK